MIPILFRGGEIVEETGTVVRDLLVEDGKVAALGGVAHRRAEVVDCEGLWVLPGLVDPHVHFCLEIGDAHTVDDVMWGSRSAVAGGVTTVADFVPQGSGAVRRALRAHLPIWLPAACDWVLHMIITRFDAAVEEELREESEAGEIRSVKVFTTYRDRGLCLDDESLFRVIECSAGGHFVTCVHAENDAMVRVLSARLLRAGRGADSLAHARPPEAEEEAVGRTVAFARHTGGLVHLMHLSCAGSARLVAAARARGVWASGETCPHYLLLSMGVLAGRNGHRFATAPPLRAEEEVQALWAGLCRGDLQVIATDSCGFAAEAKDGWGGDFAMLPGGIPGVETSLRLMVGYGVREGRIGIRDVVRLMCANPARLLGIYPTKGTLAVGSDADIVLLDPAALVPVHRSALVSRAAWSPYEGMIAAAPPERVYLRGSLVARKGQYVGDGMRGERLARGRPTRPL